MENASERQRTLTHEEVKYWQEKTQIKKTNTKIQKKKKRKTQK